MKTKAGSNAVGKRRRGNEDADASATKRNASSTSTSTSTSTSNAASLDVGTHDPASKRAKKEQDRRTCTVGNGTCSANEATLDVQEEAEASEESTVFECDLDALSIEFETVMKQLSGPYSFVRAMLSEFEAEWSRNPRDSQAMVVEDDAAWFWFAEMRFFVTFLFDMAFMEFSMSVTRPDSVTLHGQHPGKETAALTRKERIADRREMEARVTFLEQLKTYVTKLGTARLAATLAAGERLPRVFRLAKRYKLTEQETELFQLLVVLQGCQSNAVRCQMIEDDAQRKMASCQRVAGISEVDMVEFYDDQREHVKEGTLLVDEENYCTTVSLSNICVRVLLGRKLTGNQALKLSQTALEELLEAEGMKFSDGFDAHVEIGIHSAHGKMNEDSVESDFDEFSESDGGDDDDDNSAFSFIGDFKKSQKENDESAGRDNDNGHRRSKSSHSKHNHYQHSPIVDSGEMKPYNPDNQLEYLEDRFQVVAYAIRASGARVKDQMKEAGTKQPWDPSQPASAGRRELKAKQRVHDRRTAHRLSLTRKAGLALPRLEQLSRQFKLNRFEQNVIVLLIGKTISPVIKNLLDGVDTSPVQRMDESVIINQLLSVFCDTFQEQVAHRVFFYKSSRLLTRGLVKLHRGRWHSTSGDLVDQRVELDRRLLDFVVGLDTEINELVEGSDLYTPKVRLEQVVLPEEHKTTILQTVQSYEALRTFRKKNGMEESITYGAGLVLLLCGASGTGKTMTVNAVAHHLGKRVLLVDFPSLQGKRQEGVEVDADLRGLFREADMNNAVLFFDECETIFKQRDFGGDRLLNSLLTEIERHEGIVFMATNRPFDLDEAMHRRITAVFEFKPPDHIQRREIWRVLLNNKLKTADDVDWEAISLKFELSGGFIKNAILSALLMAISRQPDDPVISHDDIAAGCALQMRGSLHMKTFDHRVVPTTGMEHLVAEDGVKAKLQEIVRLEKARSVIYGQWGFDFGEDKSKQKGISALICGPPGIGKIAAAKAIGFETGRPLKVVDFSQLQSDSVAETRKAIHAIFDDARLMDAVIVLKGFEAFGSYMDISASPTDAMDSPRFRVEVLRLLDQMESFPGISVVIATVETTAMAALVQSEFARRLKFVVEMRNPNAKLRQRLWKACFPEHAPVHAKVDFVKLADRFELSNSAISDAVFRAAANAALREESDRVITMKDLMDAAEIERRKMRGSGAMDNLFM